MPVTNITSSSPKAWVTPCNHLGPESLSHAKRSFDVTSRLRPRQSTPAVFRPTKLFGSLSAKPLTYIYNIKFLTKHNQPTLK